MAEKNKVKFGIRSYGNREVLDRMAGMGVKECLRGFHNEIIPAFKHSIGTIDHQLDHLFVTENLYSKIDKCETGKHEDVFEKSLSDHLPVIADFKNLCDNISIKKY